MASLGLIDFVIIVEEKGYFVTEEYETSYGHLDGYVMVFEGEGRLGQYDVGLIEEIARYEIRGDFQVRLIQDTIEVTAFN